MGISIIDGGICHKDCYANTS